MTELWAFPSGTTRHRRMPKTTAIRPPSPTTAYRRWTFQRRTWYQIGARHERDIIRRNDYVGWKVDNDRVRHVFGNGPDRVCIPDDSILWVVET